MIHVPSLVVLGQTAEPASRIPLYIIMVYMCLLFALGWISSRLFRGSSKDFFVASQSIGPFMLLMSVFGTTMTAFALVGSTGKAFSLGIGTYGLMASSSGLIHTACFFLVGIRMWSFGKKYGYVTQIQFFRDRFESKGIGYLMFPILVGLIIPYLLVGLIGAGNYIGGVTRGMFPGTFEAGAVPAWLSGLTICLVVLFYVFFGGVRSAVWANTFQTIVFMVMGLVGFLVIAKGLGGLEAASQKALEHAPDKLSREGLMTPAHFISYMLVPLSVGMFPHLFQHWLTAKSAKAFRLTVIAHPLCIMVVWVPCVLVGAWASGLLPPGIPPPAVLSAMLNLLVGDPVLTGLLTAGVLAAIMSSLDSQFLCLGTMFTNDIVIHRAGEKKFSDQKIILIARVFIVCIVALTYALAMWAKDANVFDLAIWCFSGFSALFPVVFAALYWKRATKQGAFASILSALISWLYFFHLSGYGGEMVIGPGIIPAAICFIVAAVAMVVVSYLTNPPSKQTIEKFFPKV